MKFMQLLTALMTVAFVQANVIKGKIDTRGNPIELHKTQIILNGGEYTCAVAQDGAFNVQVAPGAGVYKLEVYNLAYFFEPVVVEVFTEEFSPGKNIKSFLFNLKQGKDISVRLAYPLHLEPTSRMQYFDEEIPFNPMNYLKNPMVLMIGVMLVMSLM